MSDPGVNSITSFNRSTLLDKPGGEEAFMLGLLAVALRSNAGMPVELRTAADAGDLESMKRLAHKIKGTAGDICAAAVHDQAGVAELAARSSATEASELNRALADAVERLLADLRRATAAGS
ncbi:MAG: Hpt domain [Pseudomonadota bacterium]